MRICVCMYLSERVHARSQAPRGAAEAIADIMKGRFDWLNYVDDVKVAIVTNQALKR